MAFPCLAEFTKRPCKFRTLYGATGSLRPAGWAASDGQIGFGRVSLVRHQPIEAILLLVAERCVKLVERGLNGLPARSMASSRCSMTRDRLGAKKPGPRRVGAFPDDVPSRPVMVPCCSRLR
jgi:hypothetical protein